jgi:hypothetical protein
VPLRRREWGAFPQSDLAKSDATAQCQLKRMCEELQQLNPHGTCRLFLHRSSATP